MIHIYYVDDIDVTKNVMGHCILGPTRKKIAAVSHISLDLVKNGNGDDET